MTTLEEARGYDDPELLRRLRAIRESQIDLSRSLYEIEGVTSIRSEIKFSRQSEKLLELEGNVLQQVVNERKLKELKIRRHSEDSVPEIFFD